MLKPLLLVHTLCVPPLAINPHLQVPPAYGESLLAPEHRELVDGSHMTSGEPGLHTQVDPPLQIGFNSSQPVWGSSVLEAQTEQVQFEHEM